MAVGILKERKFYIGQFKGVQGFMKESRNTSGAHTLALRPCKGGQKHIQNSGHTAGAQPLNLGKYPGGQGHIQDSRNTP